MSRFFAPDLAATLTLPPDESQHCVRVLRRVEGDEIEVVDGQGTLYRCRIALAHPKRCQVQIVEAIAQPTHWRHQLVLAVAPTKLMDRLEQMTDRVTEMGIDRIIPIACHNSERKVLKTERLHKIAVSAMKQSLQACLPQIDELTPVAQVLAMPFGGNRFIAYCDPMLPREQRRLLAQEYVPGTDTLILIGPEGDFSPEEVQQALQAGFKPVSLGRTRLRTETAAIAAIAACHTLDDRQLSTKKRSN